MSGEEMVLRSLIAPTCRELAMRLSKGEYENAPWYARVGMRIHLLRCTLCVRYARQLELLGEAFGSLAAQRRSAPKSEELRKSLLRRLLP